MDGVGILFVLLWYGIPIAVLIYVLRCLNVIVLGMRSINSGVERAADALERIEARGSNPPQR